MASDKTILYFGAGRAESADLVTRFAEARGLELESVTKAEEVRALLNRTFPGCVILDGSGDTDGITELSRALKRDAFTAIVPIVVLLADSAGAESAGFLSAGVDEVLRVTGTVAEV